MAIPHSMAQLVERSSLVQGSRVQDLGIPKTLKIVIAASSLSFQQYNSIQYNTTKLWPGSHEIMFLFIISYPTIL